MCLRTPTAGARTSLPHCRGASVLVLLAIAAGPAAAEPCKLARFAELPVTMQGMRPLVHAAINGKDAMFIAGKYHQRFIG